MWIRSRIFKIIYKTFLTYFVAIMRPKSKICFIELLQIIYVFVYDIRCIIQWDVENDE